jgi:hypothetical protein
MINQLVAAFAVATTVAALPIPSTESAGLRPVACATQQDLYDLLNADESRDLKAEARLTAGACRPFAGLHYEVVDEENGVLTLRLFPREGDWASSRLVFTLDEMVPAN